MRYKSLSICAIVLVVFLGLRALIQTTQPKASGHIAVLRGDAGPDPSRNRLASLASIAAGALAFAVIPGRTKPKSQNGPSTVRTRVSDVEMVVRCPQCDRRMRRILVAAGAHRGRTVWLCPQSPDCDVRPLSRRRRSQFVAEQSSGMVGRQISLS